MASGAGAGAVLAAKNHYTILEVPMSADDATIGASYRRLARLKHPDKNRDSPNATAEFQALQEAYTVLKDESKRFEYDRRLLLKKNPAGSAPRSRATAARTANMAAGSSATMAATAAAVEMLRQKRRQTQQEQSAATGAGIFSFNLNPSWDSPQPAKPVATKMPPTTSIPAAAAAAATGATPCSNKADDGTPANYSVHGTGTSYPPSPPGRPQWPRQPLENDHNLETQIRQVRKDIRADEKIIRRLTRATKKTAGEISALWETVHGLGDQVAEVTRKRSKIEEKTIEQEWLDGLFGDPSAIQAAFPMARPLSPKSAEKLKQTERAYDGLQKKLAKAHEAIDDAMAVSRKIVGEIQVVHEQKAKKEANLQELSRQWRVNQFGDRGANSETTSTWDGWCGWDEGEAGLDTDDTNDDDEHTDGARTAYQASWWYTASDEDTAELGTGSNIMYADHGSSFTFNPRAMWTPGASSSQINSHGDFYEMHDGVQNDHTGTSTSANQGQPFEYYAPADEAYGAFPGYGQYEDYEQYGQYSTPYDNIRTQHKKQPAQAAEVYFELSNEDESIGGGAVLGDSYAGKREPAQQKTEDGEQDEKREDAGCVNEEESAEDTSAPVSTGPQADPLQNTTTSQADVQEEEEAAVDKSSFVDEDDDDDDNYDNSHIPAFWPGQGVADLLDLEPSAQDENSDLLDLNTPIPQADRMTLPPLPPSSVPYRRGIASNISTLAGSAAATQAWWPGGDIAAEQNGGDVREQAWRLARWNQW